jgi:tripartite-type tricarboxylate transporter receptor subunit TctC
VQLGFDTMPTSIRAGKLRALAVGTLARSKALAHVVPKNTPLAIVERLNGEINAGLADSTLKVPLVDFGAMTLAGSPADFGKLIADEAEKWGKVIKFAGIKPQWDCFPLGERWCGCGGISPKGSIQNDSGLSQGPATGAVVG